MSTSPLRDPVGYLRRSLSLYRQLLFDPASFYDDLGSRRIRSEFLLVLVVGLIGTATAFYAASRLATIASLEADGTTMMRLMRLAASPLIGAFLLWIGGTGLLYAVSWLYTTAGSFFRLLKNTAWGLFPFLFANLLKGLGLVIVASGLPAEPAWLPDYRAINEPGEAANFLWDQVLSDPLVTGLTLLSYVFVIWSGYVLAHGVAEVRRLEDREAYLIVAGPLLLYVVYNAAQLFGLL